MTEIAVHLELAREEKTVSAVEIRHDVSPTELVAQGLQLEEAQYIPASFDVMHFLTTSTEYGCNMISVLLVHIQQIYNAPKFKPKITVSSAKSKHGLKYRRYICLGLHFCAHRMKIAMPLEPLYCLQRSPSISLPQHSGSMPLIWLPRTPSLKMSGSYALPRPMIRWQHYVSIFSWSPILRCGDNASHEGNATALKQTPCFTG